MNKGQQVSQVLDRLLDGIGACAKARSRGAMKTLCEAMRLAPDPLKTHIAKRLLDLEVSSGVETPMEYREEVGRAVQGIPTLMDHVEPFHFVAISGDGDGDDDNKEPPSLRLVRENEN